MTRMTKLMETLILEAAKLPSDEQDVLATQWLSDVRGDDVSQELRDELDRRLQDALEHPENLLSWEKVQAHIRERLGK